MRITINDIPYQLHRHRNDAGKISAYSATVEGRGETRTLSSRAAVERLVIKMQDERLAELTAAGTALDEYKPVRDAFRATYYAPRPGR